MTLAEIRLWGRTIGAVSLEDGGRFATFQYDSAFAASGIEVSPITMPLSDRVYVFPNLPERTFYGLPGLLAHFDFNQAGAYSYEQALLTIRQLNLPMEAVEEQFRRMTFNIVARNQDDHVKNIAFLMDKAGRWSLAPAFDVTYSYNPAGSWSAVHQMTMNCKRDGFTLADFRACAKAALMKRGRAEAILEGVCAAVAKWSDYAEQAQVVSAWRKQIQGNHRLGIPRT